MNNLYLQLYEYSKTLNIIDTHEHFISESRHENALQNLCTALAYRIEKGRLDMDYAKFILRLWLYDNPKKVYKI